MTVISWPFAPLPYPPGGAAIIGSGRPDEAPGVDAPLGALYSDQDATDGASQWTKTGDDRGFLVVGDRSGVDQRAEGVIGDG